MPASYRIDTQAGVVYSFAWGVATDAEFATHQRTLKADSRFRRDLRQLLDCRDVAKMEITSDGLRKLIAGNPFGAGARRALVAGSEIVFGMGRMFELGRAVPEDEFRAFRDLGEALAWPNLPPTEPAPLPTDWSSESH